MAGCRIVNEKVANAVAAIYELSNTYKTAGEDFVRDLNAALAEMEGETKDALNNFINKDVNDFVAEQLPDAVKGMSDLLEANRSNFETVDSQIAQNISSN